MIPKPTPIKLSEFAELRPSEMIAIHEQILHTIFEAQRLALEAVHKKIGRLASLHGGQGLHEAFDLVDAMLKEIES